ncbi:hypothetical protein [Paraburkholderia acidisoli]|uniref:Uncharacterized protein n=1 Tax=Paraburkholderia acidisoli TaxID=2571748 RepID=A0A7Z2JIG0_9BURK|nr:hypothetical protein [Paraburkholderia acidisoli]QGZ65153.1 hypothetical protein FAZ98_25605 [Paraburkholderia acidisoli]
MKKTTDGTRMRSYSVPRPASGKRRLTRGEYAMRLAVLVASTAFIVATIALFVARWIRVTA